MNAQNLHDGSVPSSFNQLDWFHPSSFLLRSTSFRRTRPSLEKRQPQTTTRERKNPMRSSSCEARCKWSDGADGDDGSDEEPRRGKAGRGALLSGREERPRASARSSEGGGRNQRGEDRQDFAPLVPPRRPPGVLPPGLERHTSGARAGSGRPSAPGGRPRGRHFRGRVLLVHGAALR